MEKKTKLCARTSDGTVDIWINYEGEMGNFSGKRMNIITTFNGESPEKGLGTCMSLVDQDEATMEKSLDWFMGSLGRDVENWSNKDIVIHWGVHTWTFYNKRSVTDIEKDEYTKTFDDIKFFYDIEW